MKIVYVSPEHHAVGADLDVLSPKQLDALLEAGWDILETKRVKVPHPETGKKVPVTQHSLAQKSEARGVATVNAQDPPTRRGLTLLDRAMEDRPQAGRGLAAIPGQNNDGYLGSSIAGHIPGVRAVGSLRLAAAFGVGTDHYHQPGGKAEDVPFPEGSSDFADFLDGFFRAGGEIPEHLESAAGQGKVAAQGPEHAEVTCPFRARSWEYCAWLAGFRRAGGKVESAG